MRQVTVLSGIFGLVFAAVGFAATIALLDRQERLTGSLVAQAHEEERAALEDATRKAVLRLPSELRDIVTASRETFELAGFSSEYVDGHIFLENVVQSSDGWLVQWQFSDGDRRLPLIDRITVSGSVMTHSIPGTLGRAHDFVHVVSASHADRLLVECIGSFESPVVRIGAPTVGGETVLALHGKSRDGDIVGAVNLETGECTRGVLHSFPRRSG